MIRRLILVEVSREGEGECIFPVRGGIRANVRDGLKWGRLGGTTFDWIDVGNSSEV